MNKLKEARERAGLSQIKAAEFLGLKIGTLRNWEQGRTKPPDGIEEMLVEKLDGIIPMRKSFVGFNMGYIHKDNYPGLPNELKEFNYYFADGGHIIMAVPSVLTGSVKYNYEMDNLECPIPVKYILEKGYKINGGHVIVDIPYGEYGVEYDEKYEEY